MLKVSRVQIQKTASKEILFKSVFLYKEGLTFPVKLRYSEEELKRNVKEQEEVQNYAISRAFVFNELYKAFDGYSSLKKSLNFYDDAVNWLEGIENDDHKSHFFDLYLRNEMMYPITWAELGYLWYYIINTNKTKPVSLMKLKPVVKVCMLKETDPNALSRVNFKVKDYKAGLSMNKYLDDIRKGERYMPISLYHSFECLKKDGFVKDGEYFKELTNWDLAQFIAKKKRG